MKSQSQYSLLRTLAFGTLIAGPTAHAAPVVLFSDNFDTAGNLEDGLFNAAASLTADQSGTLATKDYNTSLGGGWFGAYQRGNGGTWLMYAGASGFGSTNMYGSVNNNFATEANNLDLPLEISFNITVSAPVGGDTSKWSAFAIGASQNQFVNHPANKFSSLFRDMGGTQQFGSGVDLGLDPLDLTPPIDIINGGPTFTDGQKISFVFSDAAGTGSAFESANGANDKVLMYVDDVLTNTFTDLEFGPNDGYVTFQAIETVGNIDNLVISAVPAVSDPFADWMSTNYPSIVSPDNEADADPDNDGISNLLEYVLLDGDPLVPNPGILPTLDASGTDFVFTFHRRNVSTVDTTQTFESSPSLEAGSWTSLAIDPPAAEVVVTPNTPDPGIDEVIITVPKGANTKLFGRLQVVK